ncbi:hypothetical protein [Nocardioides sp. W7]|uniref:hypothetical protein n=1 Tax=Nocardioides sp. W7 TaxID=2931390 RepID=UPI001FD39BB8|nr:hypothetical protein [Nocardioides sp. W7]
MKSIGRFIALTVSSAVLLAVPAVAQAAPAQPAERATKFTTIKTWSGAKQQACKKSTPNGKSWKVVTRVVNGRQAEVGVGLIVWKGEKEIDRASTPIVNKGVTSKPVSVKIRKNDRSYRLEAFQYQGQMGDGGTLKLKKLRRC